MNENFIEQQQSTRSVQKYKNTKKLKGLFPLRSFKNESRKNFGNTLQ